MNLQMLNLVISFVATIVLGIIVVPKLRKLKVGQIVRDDGPKDHLKKNGTPTMGGIIIIAIILIILCINVVSYKILILPIIAIGGFGLIGFIDDYKKLVLKNTDGLSPLKKMLGLFIVSSIFVITYLNVFDLSTTIIIPFLNIPLSLSTGVYVALAIFILLATSNAVNLTDGLDGLASGIVAIIMTFFSIIAYQNGDKDMVVLGLATVGTCLGFLVFNSNPAKVFMGDTGSLALGGAIASIALILKMPLYLAIVAIVCILEVLSDILQVAYFKITKGKRLFKMAPLHHHFELCGMKETSVTLMFWLITIVACVIAYFV